MLNPRGIRAVPLQVRIGVFAFVLGCWLIAARVVLAFFGKPMPYSIDFILIYLGTFLIMVDVLCNSWRWLLRRIRG